MTTIGERWAELDGRPAGFDYTRICLAVSVLLWHSYQVPYGTPKALALWDSPWGTLFPIILPAFFALSGFLVSGSMYRNQNLRKFIVFRIIRIFPALMIEVVIAALLIGPALTTFPLSRYFTTRSFYSYFLNMIGDIHYSLPGLFPHNPDPYIVNNQLWTVPFELYCYILISLLSIVGMFSRQILVVPLFILTTCAVAIWNVYYGVNPNPSGGVDGSILILCFFGGVIIYSFKDRVPWNGRLAFGSFAIVIISTRSDNVITNVTAYLMPIFAAYTTVYVGMLNIKRSILIDSGDYSYGIYLYSYSIQQSAADLFGTSSGWIGNVAIALPVTVSCALFSWWCVEKPFLKLRRMI